MLNGTHGIKLTVRGDGKQYQFRVRTSSTFDGVAYRHVFDTTDGQWDEIILRWEDFIPTFRGQRVPDAPDLRASCIQQIGFLIADRQEGPFDIQVQEIIPVFFQ